MLRTSTAQAPARGGAALSDDTAWLDGDEELVNVKAITEAAQRVVKRTETQEAYIRAKRQLPPAHRILLEALLVCPSISEAYDVASEMLNRRFERTTFYRWRQNGSFKLAMELAQRALLESHEAFTREGATHRNEQVYQAAMEPKPVLYKGEPTGFFQRDLGHALTALDQRNKMLGLYKDEQRDVAVNLNIDFGSYGETIEGEFEDVESTD